MIGQGLLGLLFAVMCLTLAAATFWQGREWNRVIGYIDWEQTICSWVLTFIVGMMGLGLLGFALGCFFQAGYNA